MLLRHTFPDATYVLLEDPDVVSRLRADPRAFVEGLRPPVLLDEVQNAPELFAWVRTRIDARPRRTGQFLLSGSQEAPLMQGVTESLAGRVAVFALAPFSVEESPRATWFRGGYPEPLARPSTAATWYGSYVQTYLERDVRQVTGVRDLAAFRRFLSLVAARTGQTVNRTGLARPLGVSIPTISQWLSVLEVTGQVLLVEPYFENFGKRITKSPKLYVADSGLACHLLGITSERDLVEPPFAGAIFEGHVASEIAKAQVHRGRRRTFWFFRDQQGLEVDFLVPTAPGRLCLVEAKASRTVVPRDAASALRLAEAMGASSDGVLVVHRKVHGDPAGDVLCPGARAVGVGDLIARITSVRAPGVV
jgi:predicted AAA+ superfamily ATPase